MNLLNMKIFETVENIWRSANCKNILQNQRSSFIKLYRRRSFVHKYIDKGLDNLEFKMADSNLKKNLLTNMKLLSNETFLSITYINR